MRRKEENRGRKHLSIAFALCLVISIVALPAFAGQFGEESQEDVVSFESDEPIVLSEDLMSGFEEDTTGEEGVTEEGLPEESAPDWVQPEDGVTVTRPETEQSEEKPGLPEQVVTAVTDEFAFMKMNSTGDDIDLQSDEPEEKSYPLNKPYDQLRLSGYKKWVGDFAKTSVPDSVTLQLRGYLDVNDNGTLDDEDRAYFASVAKGVNKAELPARVKEEPKTVSRYVYDYNGNGTVDAEDTYYDTNANGQIDGRANDYDYSFGEGYPSNAIDAPYILDEVTLTAGDDGDLTWDYNFDALDKYYYEHTQAVKVTENEDGTTSEEKLPTFVPATDEDGNHITKRYFYEIEEVSVTQNGVTKKPGEAGFMTDITQPKPNDDGTYDSDIDNLVVTNELVGNDGQLVITKTFDDKIFANGSTDANGNQQYATNNNLTVVFHIQAVVNGASVDYGYKALKFTSPDTKQITLSNLPVGAEFTVTEVMYPGCGYTVSGTDSSQTKTITAESATEPIKFAFVNVRPADAKDTPNQGFVNTYSPNEDGTAYNKPSGE